MTWRAIQDTVAASESLARLSATAERLYWRILSQTDAWGRLPGAPPKVRAMCAPLLGLGDSDIAGALDELVAAERILLYCVSGEWVIEVTDFEKNQPRELLRRRGSSRFPDPPSSGTDPGASGPRPAQTERERRGDKGSNHSSGLDTPGHAADLKTAEEASPNGATRRNGHKHVSWETVHEHLSGADERTPEVIRKARRGLPEAALYRAYESLEIRRGDAKKRPLESEVRYFVASLNTMRNEGQFS